MLRDISTSVQFDLVVIGGGIAGMVAANRAAELGLSVSVLEKGSEEKYLCNTRFTGGAFHICMRDINSDEALLKETIIRSTHDFAAKPSAEAVAKDGRRLVRWLRDQGVRLVKGGPEEWQQWMLAPPGIMQTGLHWEGRGGDVLLRTFDAGLTKRGGQLRRNARARELIMRNGRCGGVIAEIAGSVQKLEASAVVIADGGFQANADLVRTYISPRPEALHQRGAATGAGDGLLMAQSVSARLVGMDNFYGHLLSRDARKIPKLWPYPILDYVATAGIVVNSEGRRFMDEGRGGVFMANAVARLEDPLSCFVVFDQAIWDGPARQFILPANPNLPKNGAQILRANDLDTLSQMMGLPGSNLLQTVGEYNRAGETGSLDQLSPVRTVDAHPAFPIVQSPFYAARICAGITYTMGGIAIDENGRVLDTDDRPIPGLFAAGCCTGGLEGGPFAGYIGALTKSGVTALRSAEAIAAELTA